MKIVDKMKAAMAEKKTFFSFEYFPPRTEEVRRGRALRLGGGAQPAARGRPLSCPLDPALHTRKHTHTHTHLADRKLVDHAAV